jgi:AraC-like DNA-binding protein
MAKIISSFNSMLDSFFFHHSLSEPSQAPRMYGPESHRQFEIIYLVEGEVKYFIEGEEFLAKTGDVIFVAPHEIHSLHIKGEINYERIVVMFDYSLIKEMLSLGGISAEDSFFSTAADYRIIPRSLADKYHIKDVICEISQLQEKDCGETLPLRFFSSVLTLVVELRKLFSTTTEAFVAPMVKDPVVKSAIEYINSHISERISLQDIANHLYVGRSTLCHKFNRHMNISINRYIAVKKIYHAAELIKNGMSATEACYAVGYEHYTTFYHNYKQIIGSSPSEK